MALVPEGTEQIGGSEVWRFRDPTDGKVFLTDNYIQALHLGAPPKTPEFSNAAPQVAAPAAMPDARTASLGGDFASPSELASSADRQKTVDALAASEAAKREQVKAVGGYGYVDTYSGRETGVSQPVSAPPMIATGPDTNRRQGMMTRESMPQVEPQQAPMAPTSSMPQPRALLTPEQGQALLTPQRISWGARKGGEMEQGKSTSGIGEDSLKELKGTHDKLYDRQQELVDMQAQNRVMELSTKNKQLSLADQQLSEQVATKQREAAERERLVAAEKKKLDDEEQKIVSRSPEVGRLWKQKGSGALAITAVLAGVNEFARIYGRTGGENNVLNIMNTAIERDLDEQAAEIAADKDAIGRRKNALAERLANGEDPKFAREALKNLMLKQQQVQLDHEDTRKLLRASGVDAEQARVALANAYLEGRMKLEQMQQEKVDYKMQQARAAGSRFETPEEMAKRVNTTVDTTRKVAENAGLVPTEKQADMLYAEQLKQSGEGAGTLQTAQVTGLNKAMSNAKLYKRATTNIEKIFDSGEDIELDPSLWSKWQSFTSTFKGDRAAQEDTFGVGGAKLMDEVNTAVSGTHNEALGTLQEADKRNIIQSIVGDGKRETILSNLQAMENKSLDELKTWAQSLSAKQNETFRAQASPDEAGIIDRARNNDRNLGEVPDLRDR